MQKTWAGINSLINLNGRCSNSITFLRYPNGELTHNPFEIPNILNNYFTSVGPNLASKISQSNRHFSECLPRLNYSDSFFFNPVSPAEIESEIMLLPLNKASGLYSIPTRILKSARHIISKPLADIIHISIIMGKYPSKLKQAKVIPVFKSEDPTDPSNYRPISLLVFNRIFEKLMYKQLKSFIDSNGILFSGQYGFRDKHSTQYALLDIVNAIQENIDRNVFSCGIFLDFKKAFDTVDLSVFETVFIFMHDVAHDSVPLNLKNLFRSSNQVHSYNTRFSSAGN